MTFPALTCTIARSWFMTVNKNYNSKRRRSVGNRNEIEKLTSEPRTTAPRCWMADQGDWSRVLPVRQVLVQWVMLVSQPGEESKFDKEEGAVRVVKVLGARKKRGRVRFLLSFATACIFFFYFLFSIFWNERTPAPNWDLRKQAATRAQINIYIYTLHMLKSRSWDYLKATQKLLFQVNL